MTNDHVLRPTLTRARVAHCYNEHEFFEHDLIATYNMATFKQRPREVKQRSETAMKLTRRTRRSGLHEMIMTTTKGSEGSI